MKFTTTILRGGKTATGIEVPAEIVAALGAGKHPPVRVTFKGYSYRSSVAVMGGKYMVGISAEHRHGAGVAGGDSIEVEIDLDTAPRQVAVPPDFAAALAGDARAQGNFEALAHSHQLRHVLAINDAKTPETRQRRIEKSVAMLREGRK